MFVVVFYGWVLSSFGLSGNPAASCETRYELAQQLQPQSEEDPLGTDAVAHELPVEMETESLPQATAATAEQQGLLELSQVEVVNGGQQVTLEAPLTNQPLVQNEGKNSYICF